ncbi:hypothetical protein PO124_10685 [Bacillus licheniformis]|nr:hypothetical protein [Bacillus licheniformis]
MIFSKDGLTVWRYWNVKARSIRTALTKRWKCAVAVSGRRYKAACV